MSSTVPSTGGAVLQLNSSFQRFALGFNRFCQVVQQMETGLVMFLFLAMLVVSFLQVVYRYVLAAPLPWSEELARYLFVSCTFTGTGVVVAHKLHIEINVLSTVVAKFPVNRQQRILWWFDLVKVTLTVIFLSIFLIFTYTYLRDISQLGQKSTAMGLPMIIPMSSLLIGSALMILHYLEFVLLHLAGLTSQDEAGEIA
ncbi:MAG: TRAP transporter small permease [Bacillota bacterium]